MLTVYAWRIVKAAAVTITVIINKRAAPPSPGSPLHTLPQSQDSGALCAVGLGSSPRSVCSPGPDHQTREPPTSQSFTPSSKPLLLRGSPGRVWGRKGAYWLETPQLGSLVPVSKATTRAKSAAQGRPRARNRLCNAVRGTELDFRQDLG